MLAGMNFLSRTLTLTLVLSAPGATQARAKKPLQLSLPEFTQLEEVEELKTQRHMLRMAKQPVLLAWTELRFRKAKLAGKPVYEVESVGEMAEPLKSRFRSLHSRAIYDADLGLIALANAGEYRGKPVQESYRWVDGKLMYQRGKRKKQSAIKGSGRPILSELLLVEEGRLAAGKKRVVPVFDPLKKKIEDITFEHVDGEWTLGGKPVLKFESSQEGGMTSYVTAGAKGALGILEQAELQKQPLLLLHSDASREEISKSLMANPIVTNAVLSSSKKAWKVSGNKWKNAALGIEMRFPKKGWKLTKGGSGFQVVVATSADGNGYASLIVESLTPAMSFDSYIAMLVAQLHKEMTPPGEHKRSKVRLASHKGVRIEYERSVKATKFSVAQEIVFVGDRAYRLLMIDPKGAKTFDKDLSLIRKGLKLRKPR